MSDLTDFLLARIAEDEGAAQTPPEHYAPFEREWEWCPQARTEPLGDLEWGPDSQCECGVRFWKPDNRAQRECEAKRRITEAAAETLRTEGAGFPADDSGYDEAHSLARFTLRTLAAVYAEHPDYRDEWRP